ncbi:MAG: Rod shape-determining protein MreD [Cytophagaceae bacterium]|nr:Rod shape-determining protein MreD [Cytophagaceae bacterium]
MLPFETPALLLLFIAFLLGMTIDIFYDTLGIHAAASVLIAYIRPYIINILTPKGGYDKGTTVSIPSLGFQWMTMYAGVMIFIHHLTLFILELWGVKLFFELIGKSLASGIFTLMVFTLFQYLFLGNKYYK